MLLIFGNDDYSYDREFTHRCALRALAVENGLHSEYSYVGVLHHLTFHNVWSRQSSRTYKELCSALVNICDDLEEQDYRGYIPLLRAVGDDDFYKCPLW